MLSQFVTGKVQRNKNRYSTIRYTLLLILDFNYHQKIIRTKRFINIQIILKTMSFICPQLKTVNCSITSLALNKLALIMNHSLDPEKYDLGFWGHLGW